jgi:hypothetical protein
MAQSWVDLLFAHWPVPVSAIRPLIPAGLEVDTFGGSAWVGVVPFAMRGVRFRTLPPIPGMSSFLELNVRTYVTDGRRAGVWFLSLDADSALAIAGARRWMGLPYHHARIERREEGAGWRFESDRADTPAVFRGSWRPGGGEFRPKAGSLEHFLAERYCLFAVKGTTLLCAEVHHEPWTLRAASGEIRENTMARAAGIEVTGAPILHATRGVDAVVWGPEPLA